MIISTPFAGLFEVALPIVIALFITRRLKASWKFVGIGAVIFIASQVVHIPLLQGLTYLYNRHILPAPLPEYQLLNQAVILGLAAGFCEETARLIGFALIGKKNRSLKNTLALGIGHGGVESIIVGFAVLGTFVTMLVYRQTNNLPNIAGLAQQVQAYWATPWHTALAGAVERISAVLIHLSCAILVMLAFIRRNGWFYFAALIWHALIDFSAVYLSGIAFSVWGIEGVMLGFAVICVAIIYFCGRFILQREKLQEQAEAVVPVTETQDESLAGQ